jgi:hypothetical protein
MRNSRKAILVIFVTCLSLVAAQGNPAFANQTITGTVYEINTTTNSIVVDDGQNLITVYCIPLTYLDKKNIVIDVGTEVVIEVYDRSFSNGTTRLIAVNLIVDGQAVKLPGNNPNRS